MAQYHKKTLIMLSTLFISLFIYFLTAFNDRLLTLHSHWTTADDLDMGYLLLAISGYFIFSRIKSATTTNIAPNFVVLPVIALLSGLLFISTLLDIKTLFFICFFLTFPACIAAVLGFKITLKILVPLSIIAMAMPFWYILIPLLQTLTVVVVSYVSEQFSLTVLIEGNYFTVPTGVVHVAGGCSGLKYFMTAISLALISSALNKRSIKFSLLSTLCALSLALLANWIRVFILLIVAYIGGIDQPVMKDHDFLGWVVFAVLMAPWFFVDNFINKITANKTDTDTDKNSTASPVHSIKATFSLIICLCLLSAPMLLLHNANSHHVALTKLELPEVLAGHKQTNHHPNWQLDYPIAASEARAQYSVNNEKLDLIIRAYNNSDKSAELANSTNTVYKQPYWHEIQSAQWQSIKYPDIKINITLIKNGFDQKVVYSWYKHGRRYANSILSSKLNQLISQLNGVQSSELLVILKDCDNACTQNPTPTESLLNFIQASHQSN